jgi:hypothetical protein
MIKHMRQRLHLALELQRRCARQRLTEHGQQEQQERKALPWRMGCTFANRCGLSSVFSALGEMV